MPSSKSQLTFEVKRRFELYASNCALGLFSQPSETGRGFASHGAREPPLTPSSVCIFMARRSPLAREPTAVDPLIWLRVMPSDTLGRAVPSIWGFAFRACRGHLAFKRLLLRGTGRDDGGGGRTGGDGTCADVRLATSSCAWLRHRRSS